MDIEDQFVSASSLAHRIRYALAQLRARNGHHTFEDICREFSRVRISRNVLAATGPVGTGGDQGRDFETFRSFIQDSVDHGFAAVEPIGRIAFTCTLQQEGLADKIRSDLVAVMNGGPIVAVYSFCEADVPVAHRHKLQEWANRKYQVELEIIDGNGLAEQLATSETFWIASTYLHLPVSLAPPRIGYDRPQQLPVGIADFAGRARELAELRDLCRPAAAQEKLGGNKVVVITGPPGTGKSALAIRLAHELAAEYTDGQLYTNLRGTVQEPPSSSAVLGHFVRALGSGRIQSPDDSAELAGTYRTLLANRRVLVVLDNATDEGQLRPLLSGGPECLMLVTSRNSLPALEGATAYRLGVMESDESLALLASIAGDDRLTLDPVGCKEVIQYCGRLPLAIRIAGSRLRARGDWTPAHLAKRLADARRRLDQLRLGDLDVRASFDLSYRDLDRESGQLFRRLSVVPGLNFSAELTEVLMDGSEASAEDALDRLVIDQLVMPADVPGYYQMHDLLRLFAAECFRDADEEPEQPVGAVLGWYARRLAQVGPYVTLQDSWDNPWDTRASSVDIPSPRRAEAMAWFSAEADNLISVLRASDKLGLDLYTSRVAAPIADYARQSGLWEEWATAVEVGLDAARRIDDSSSQVRLLFARGEMYASKADWSGAVTCWKAAIKMADGPSSPVFRGTLHNRLAHTYFYMGRVADAEDEMVAARDAFGEIDAALAAAAYASFHFELLMSGGHPEEASDLLERHVLPVFGRLGFQGQAEMRTRLASAYTAQGRHAEALRQLADCRKLCKDNGLRPMEPIVLLLLGEAYQSLNLTGRARKAWQEGLQLAQRNVHPAAVGHLSMKLGAAAFAARELTEAAKMFAQAVDGFNAANVVCQRANALHSMASMKWLLGDRDGAEAGWAEAFRTLDSAADQTNALQVREAIKEARSKLRRLTVPAGVHPSRDANGARR